MATKKRNQKLFITLTAFIAGITIIVNLIQAVIVIENVRAKVVNDNLSRYESIARDYSYIVKNRIEEFTAHLDYYTKADIVKTHDSAAITDWLHQQKDKRYENFDYVAWIDPQGNFTSDIGTATKVPDRDYFKAIMNEGKDFYIDDAVTSKTSGKTVLHICKAVKENGKNTGFFCAVIDVTHLTSLLDDIQLQSNSSAMLYSGTNYKLSVIGNNDLVAGFEANEDLGKQVLAEIKQGNIGSIQTIDKNVGKFVTVYAPIVDCNWSMNILLKYDDLAALSKTIATMMTTFSTFLGAMILLVTAISVYNSIKPLNIVEKGLRDISSGNADLTKRIDVKSNNEIGRVADDFNAFSEKLQSIMKSIKDTKEDLVSAGQQFNDSTADTASAITEIISNIESMGNNINTQTNSVSETAGAVNEIASNIESLNKMIESQASAVTQASTAVEEMIGNINSVNSSITRMATEFKALEQKSIAGLQMQDDVSNKIGVVADESEALQEANAVISNIAEQTNLLAMNAAIEAAHAGEAGKGFSVVADEIRKLSETSSQQSDTIGKQLKKIIDSIAEIVQASSEARNSFSEVSKGINATTSLVEEISNSMEEQSEGSKQISVALNNMNDTTSQVRTSSYEMSEGNRAILEEVKHLQDSTYSMKTGMDEMSVGAKQINQAGAQLNEIAAKMENSISQIGNQVDEFKV